MFFAPLLFASLLLLIIHPTIAHPLLTLPISQNTTSLLLPLSATNATPTAPEPRPRPRYPIYCYTQPAPPRPPRPTALSTDCFLLARRMVRRLPYPERQERWSRDPALGLRVPKTFVEKTCVFEMDLPADTRGAWTASFADIAFGSNEVAAPCVYDGVHLGGRTKVGPEGKLDLLIYGKVWDPPEPPDDISVARRVNG
ncbi:MAG: hypothetical protein Q9202_002034 [Teloschistes flavicans]